MQQADFHLSGYELVRPIASGGMADVFEARQVTTTRRVAVKLMKPHLLESTGSRKRFAREVQAMAALQHDNIVGVLDAGGEEGGRPFITMEYVAGCTLRSTLREHGSLPWARACEIALQVARGLQHAHQAGVVHRDLKPENIMLCTRADESERALLVDFGVASILDEPAGTSLTAEGTLLGTPHYMAPEQARGERLVSAAADVYALGAVLYEMLSGKRAHEGATRQAVLHHVLYHRPPALCVTAWPEALPALIERCLRKRPDRRPPASEIVRCLHACLAASRPPASFDSHSHTAHALAVPARRLPFWAGPALLSLGLALGGALGWLSRDPNPLEPGSGAVPQVATTAQQQSSPTSFPAQLASVATPKPESLAGSLPQAPTPLSEPHAAQTHAADEHASLSEPYTPQEHAAEKQREAKPQLSSTPAKPVPSKPTVARRSPSHALSPAKVRTKKPQHVPKTVRASRPSTQPSAALPANVGELPQASVDTSLSRPLLTNPYH